jgi:hypothetical protein
MKTGTLELTWEEAVNYLEALHQLTASWYIARQHEEKHLLIGRIHDYNRLRTLIQKLHLIAHPGSGEPEPKIRPGKNSTSG